jgi:hypothetical protein
LSDAAPHLGPSGEACEGPSYPRSIKLLATLLMAALAWQGLLAFDALREAPWSTGPVLFLLLALATIVTGYAVLLRSRTAVDATGIRESGLLPREAALQDVVQLQFLYLPRLDWLVVPRLVVKLRGGRRLVFHSADRRVQQAFARLAYGADTFED